MSAFLCPVEHIKELALYAVFNDEYGILVREYGNGDRTLAASTIANILYAQNVRSVFERYEDESVLKNKIEFIPISKDDRPKISNPVWIIKMCQCYEYQSCETSDWYYTKAFELISEIKSIAIKNLDGYEQAPWVYERKERENQALI